MNRYLVARTLLASTIAGLCGTAQAELLVAKGTKGTLTAAYEYSAVGQSGAAAKGGTKEWNVKRRISITAVMSADALQPIPSMHPLDASQTKDMDNKQARGMAAQRKMAPMMADMEQIVTKCGDNEACITREISNYGKSMQMTPDLKSAGEDIAAISKQTPRFQTWKSTSQSGTYSLNETYRRQVYEMTCTDKPGQQCKSEEIRTGGGPIESPAGNELSAFAAMLEVDSVRKDMVVKLPVPLAPLSQTRKVVTSIPGEKSSTTTGPSSINVSDIKTITIALPGDLRAASGTETIKLKGDDGESGTVKVTWTFVPQS